MQVEEAANRLVREMRRALRFRRSKDLGGLYRVLTRRDAEVEIELKNLIEAI